MKTKLPSLITILVLTVLTSVLWISFGIYRAITKEPSPAVPRDISQALTPTLDKNTIDDIKSRQFFNEVPTTVITIQTPTATASAAPVPEETPTATASATPTQSPTSEAGGVTP